MRTALLLIIALSGCGLTLTQHSVAPPGRSARLDEVSNFWGVQYYRLEVSQGVALAVRCDRTGPCEHMNVISENPAVAEVRPASLAALQQIYYTTQQQPQSAFVIIGKTPGETKLHVKERKGTRDVVVKVIAPPPPPNAQTVVSTQ